MKRTAFLAVFLLLGVIVIFGQKPQKDKLVFKEYQPGYYQNVIMKDINAVKKKKNKPQMRKYPEVDMQGYNLPNKLKYYKYFWHNPPISQGNTGTCWDFSTTSFLESEEYRIYHKKVKLSEMYTVYWEYVEKAREFVRTRGKSNFGEGSEANAVTRMWKKYGIVPLSVYKGDAQNLPFYDHSQMFEEMSNFLKSVKENNIWNEQFVISTIKSILNKYMGEPPTKFTYEGKEYTPHTFLTDYLKLNPDDYVDIISLKTEPYWQKVEYKVPDNWWHSKEYYNVPLDVFMNIIDNAIRNGYTMSIGGDVSEPGFSRETQCAIIPTFDIPPQYIDDDARAFRFANRTTTDDHGMHLVGYADFNGQKWYLIKDSSSGSRNNDPNAPEFGYYFFRWDYIKLKMIDIMIHKDAVKDVLKKFK